jgi:hypothetical protein
MGQHRRMALLKTILCTAVGLFLAGLGIGGSKNAPENARVIIDPASNTYRSPPCSPQTQQLFSYATISQVRKRGLEPDAACRDKGGLVQEDRSLSGWNW